jgi:hypothetical protein
VVKSVTPYAVAVGEVVGQTPQMLDTHPRYPHLQPHQPSGVGGAALTETALIMKSKGTINNIAKKYFFSILILY